MSSTLNRLAQELRELEDQLKEAEGHASALRVRRDRIKNKDLPEAMETAEIDKFTVDGVGTVYITQRAYGNILAANRDDAYAWFKENGFGDLVKETVHPQTLNAFAKEQLENGAELPEFITVAYQRNAAIRKA